MVREEEREGEAKGGRWVCEGDVETRKHRIWDLVYSTSEIAFSVLTLSTTIWLWSVFQWCESKRFGAWNLKAECGNIAITPIYKVVRQARRTQLKRLKMNSLEHAAAAHVVYGNAAEYAMQWIKRVRSHFRKRVIYADSSRLYICIQTRFLGRSCHWAVTMEQWIQDLGIIPIQYLL